MSLFPVFLKLRRRRCLVVGAGPVGEGKARGLLGHGATLRIVGPRATETIKRWAKKGKVVWYPRFFQPADLEGVFLVVVATSSRQLNERVHQEALRRRVLCNVVDDPEHCDFYYGSIVRRGPLQIAISTSGHSPALARRLKRELEEQFGPEIEAWVEQLGEARRRLRATTVTPKCRQRLLRRLASRESFADFVRDKAARGCASSTIRNPERR